MKNQYPMSEEKYELIDSTGTLPPISGTITQIIDSLEWVANKYTGTMHNGKSVYIPPFEVEQSITETSGLPYAHYTWFTDMRPALIEDRATGYPAKLERLMFIAEPYTNDGNTRTRLIDDPAPQGKVTGRLIPCPRNIDNVAAYAKLVIDTLSAFKGGTTEAVIETRPL